MSILVCQRGSTLAPAPTTSVSAVSNVTTSGLFSATLVLIPLKLDRANYSFWRSLILPSVRAFDLEDFLLGTRICPMRYVSLQQGEGSSSSTHLQIGSLTSQVVAQRVNPNYIAWMRTDQALMSWLLSSISESILGHVIHCTSSAQIWLTLQQFFTTTSKAWVLQLRFQLQSTKKVGLSIQDNILKIRGIGDSLNSTGLILYDEELLLYILGGLKSEYDPVVINLTSRHESVSLQEAQYMLQSQEIRIE